MEIDRQIDAMNAAIDRLDTNQKIIDLNQDKIVATQVYFSEILTDIVNSNDDVNKQRVRRYKDALEQTLGELNVKLKAIDKGR